MPVLTTLRAHNTLRSGISILPKLGKAARRKLKKAIKRIGQSKE